MRKVEVDGFEKRAKRDKEKSSGILIREREKVKSKKSNLKKLVGC